ncbi:Inosine-5'-monophosphate dehydrogenase [Nonomuraea coxensis DSM 45129]|uniref:Inosine-5'-monophosphate dehydrogenase n=1 Tax=Nonomuraea coxensis DSM 45129 TaxID=1122611 RepID=A0ABX8U6F9_9ACTN|nr:CBS domain-containing protein [Nonomuraea coxensis]QYC42496.1 Inosine-5'-monophosphate dehydrogenase [Nonomuraea coxensis DSM 45129]
MRTTVRDVMTTQVAAVNEKASFHVVAELLIRHGVSGVPVLDDDGRVRGVVSEADLLAKEEFKERYYGDDYRPPLRARVRHHAGSEGSGRRKALGETAGELMTSPAHVVTPETPVVQAARLMDRHGVKRLPVVDAGGRLAGIVSRRDLIKVFVRPDQEIKALVAAAVPPGVDVEVSEGVVTLAGAVDRHSEAMTAARVTGSVDGVVAVRDEMGWKRDDVADIPMWGGA